MNKDQLAVIWIVGVLLSALWIHSWIVKPWVLLDPSSRSYLLSLGGPILILGACAFLHVTFYKKGK